MAAQDVSFQPIGHGQQINIAMTYGTETVYLGRAVSSDMYDTAIMRYGSSVKETLEKRALSGVGCGA